MTYDFIGFLFVLVLLFAHAERFSVFRMHFFKFFIVLIARGVGPKLIIVISVSSNRHDEPKCRGFWLSFELRQWYEHL